METTIMHANMNHHHKMIETKDYDVSLESLNTIFSEIYSTGNDRLNDDSSSASSSIVDIDTMIVQIVDMVKTHLLYAVREEFDVLQEKIVHLENKVAHLENENKILRQFAPTHVVARMDNREMDEIEQMDNDEIDCTFINGGYSR